jgi:hypothetical protein
MAATAPERELLKRFEVQKFLGKGSYGSVYVDPSARASRPTPVISVFSRITRVGFCPVAFP